MARSNGMEPLPCKDAGVLRPIDPLICGSKRHYVTPEAKAALTQAAERLARRYPGLVVRYMEASWPIGRAPMPPHYSHGDGRQIDLALFYETTAGRPLAKPPKPARYGYGAYEPPRREADRVCVGVKGPHAEPDPRQDRTWRMAERPVTDLIRLLADDRRVKRLFVEPHLKARLGLSANQKVRFAGCRAARHDDHLHVDFH